MFESKREREVIRAALHNRLAWLAPAADPKNPFMRAEAVSEIQEIARMIRVMDGRTTDLVAS